MSEWTKTTLVRSSPRVSHAAMLLQAQRRACRAVKKRRRDELDCAVRVSEHQSTPIRKTLYEARHPREWNIYDIDIVTVEILGNQRIGVGNRHGDSVDDFYYVVDESGIDYAYCETFKEARKWIWERMVPHVGVKEARRRIKQIKNSLVEHIINCDPCYRPSDYATVIGKKIKNLNDE